MVDTSSVRGAARPQKKTSQGIQAACEAELTERGYSALSMEGVARRAGVGKGALYRRWPDKQSMVASVLSNLTSPLGVSLVWGDDNLASDLNAFAGLLDAWLEDPRIIADLIAAQLRDPALSKAIEEILGKVIEPWLDELEGRARRRGDPSPGAAAADISGALFWRRAVLQQSPSSSDLARLAHGAAASILAG